MPYIAPNSRKPLDDGTTAPSTPGELNYVITNLLIDYVSTSWPPSYGMINAAIGALEAAKLEFYRRVVVPYEDKKIIQNGDVFPVNLR